MELAARGKSSHMLFVIVALIGLLCWQAVAYCDVITEV